MSSNAPPSTEILARYPQTSDITVWLKQQAGADGGTLQSVDFWLEDDLAELRPLGWSADDLDLSGTVIWQ